MSARRETTALGQKLGWMQSGVDLRRGTRWTIRDACSLRRRRLDFLTSGLGCRGTRGLSVRAVETTSRPAKGFRRQSFVQPQWLLPSSLGNEQGTRSNVGEQDVSTSGRIWSQNNHQQEAGALYYVVINTSKDDRSGLSEPNSGILLSMIGESGKAILQRIPDAGDESSNLQSGGAESSLLRFQQGAVDVVTVLGPDLGRLAAFWIAPEAGTWRTEKISVTILPWSEELLGKDGQSGGNETSLIFILEKLKESAANAEWKAIFHLFETREALLGDDTWFSAAELKPSFVQETRDAVELQEKVHKWSPKLSQSLQDIVTLREESMKEYENLKFSLLGFSSLLVAAGTATFVALGQDKLAEGFAIGGVGGFLYLFLLQRAVDQLPASLPADTSKSWMDLRDGSNKMVNTEESNNGESGDGVSLSKSGNSSPHPKSLLSRTGGIGLRGRIALILGMALLLGRSAGGGAVGIISPPELLAGVVGFLTSKFAVVLAALRPTSQPRDKE